MTSSPSFPPELLEQSSAAKLHYFKGITVPHLHLQTALDHLLLNLQEPADTSIVFIVGPSGVGKTTLRLRAEKILLENSLPRLRENPEIVPVAGVDVVAPEQGKFSHRDYYIRLLEAIGDVLVSYKTYPGYDFSPDPIHTTKNSAALRRSLEQVLHRRQVKTLMIDEAQHLLMMAGAHQMLQQMNWIKSIANITRTTHVLFGTYELLNCCGLSGQLSRRSEDLHLSRYHLDAPQEVTEFLRILHTFQAHMPFPDPPSLDQWYEYLLQYSIGCIGILKHWLLRALRSAMLEDAPTLTLEHLQHTEISTTRYRQLQEEVKAGERQLHNDKPSHAHSSPSKQSTQPKPPSRRKGRVGTRKPKRDPVGGQT